MSMGIGDANVAAICINVPNRIDGSIVGFQVVS